MPTVHLELTGRLDVCPDRSGAVVGDYSGKVLPRGRFERRSMSRSSKLG